PRRRSDAAPAGAGHPSRPPTSPDWSEEEPSSPPSVPLGVSLEPPLPPVAVPPEVGPELVLGSWRAGAVGRGGVWPVPWVSLGVPLVALLLPRGSPGVVEGVSDGLAEESSRRNGEAGVDGGFCCRSPGVGGSGEPGCSLRGASSGPGTTTW